MIRRSTSAVSPVTSWLRRAPRSLVASAVAGGRCSATAVAAVATTASPVAAGPASLDLVGHGNGHGIGMSQWGAYGYAADHGWSAAQILDHYYGGTVAGTTDATNITVRLMNLDGLQTPVIHDAGALVVDGVAGGPWRSVVVRRSPTATTACGLAATPPCAHRRPIRSWAGRRWRRASAR
ncbi:MAG: hypothetical protein R2713_21260 [Ilumatobacteraceae bacterium]